MSGPFNLLRSVRDLALPPGPPRLTATDKLVLVVLVMRSDERHECWPSIARLSQDTWLDRSAVKRSVRRLTQAGLLEVTRRNDDAGDASSNLYRVRLGVGAQSTHLGADSTHPGAQNTDPGAQDPQGVGAQSTGGGCFTRPEVPKEVPISEVPKEVPKEVGEGEAPPAPPPSDEFTTQEQGFRIADAVAERHGRPKPTRGPKSTEALARLLDEAREMAKGAPWVTEAELLEKRLRTHYEREDDVLVKCRWPLSMASQVEQATPTPPSFPTPPVKPEKPTPPMTDVEIDAMAAGFTGDFAYMAEPMRAQMRAYRNGGYQKALAAYPMELAAWELRWAAYVVERDRVKAIYAAVPEPPRNGTPVVQRATWGWGWFQQENEKRALRGGEVVR